MPKVVAVQEISRALKSLKPNEEFIYAPRFINQCQASFFQRRFDQIKLKVEKAEYHPNQSFDLSDGDRVFSWDSHEETLCFGLYIPDQSQNRLLKTINFETPHSFSGFRRKVEKVLPSFYDDAIEPFDKDVRDRIEYYFYKSNFPSTYFETRNGMEDFDASSKFSSFLACGALDVRYLYNQIKLYEERNGSNKSTYWLVFELLWREFFYWHYQRCQNEFFSSNGINGPDDFSSFKTYSIEELKSLDDHPFWQASLNELESTGFQSNRTRQMFASFWIHELQLHWRSGAQLLQDYLIDYDVYSNWGNWMYLAGVGVDSKGSRRFNIQGQLERYDNNGDYINRWNK
ncbi:MAG: hypothetical protein HRT44_09810 [Bdellovibrionales bacterium]|nr:hypothetical protein [Bdellovibrionales bacterium]NQZ19534.1 hypothetical protein [Bdellovibrionales bacterium]